MSFDNTTIIQLHGTTSGYLRPLPETIIIGIVTSLIALATTVFNFITLLAFALNRSLRKFGDYFILNLAVADMAIGVMSIPPYIPYVLTGQWSAGRSYCLFWLLWDYIAPAASTFNMCVISLDRYLLVAFPIWYRQHQSTRLLLLMMLTPWVIVTLVYLPSILLWELISGEQTISEGHCTVPYAYNLPFLLFGSAVEFVFPCILMTSVNLLIFLNIRRRSKRRIGSSEPPIKNTLAPELFQGATRVHPLQRSHHNKMSTLSESSSLKYNGGHGSKDQNDHDGPNNRNFHYSRNVNVGKGDRLTTNIYSIPEGGRAQNGTDENNHKSGKESGAVTKYETMNENSVHEDTVTVHHEGTGIVHHVDTGTVHHEDTGTVHHEDTGTVCPPVPAVGGIVNSEHKIITVAESITVIGPSLAERGGQTRTGTGSKEAVSHTARQEAIAYRRDRKAARSLFILVFVFTLCWLPYEIIALITAVCPTCIRPVYFEISFWLLWFNSTINPILYPLLHRRFRDAFFNLMRSAGCCKSRN